MKKILFLLFVKVTLVVGFNVQSINAMDTGDITYKLDTKNRPIYVKESIDLAYNSLKEMNMNHHDWVYFGRDDYKILDFQGDAATISGFLKSLIAKGQKEINILDVGAGNFSWGKHLANTINELLLDADNIHVNIISLTGESHKGEEVQQQGKCTVYNFGSFKIEDLNDELEKKGLYLNNNVDLAVSQLTFIHLVDPLGTLQKVVNLLRPYTGLLINGWANFNLKYEPQNSAEPVSLNPESSKFYFHRAILNMDLDFFADMWKSEGYVIKKKTFEEICFPFAYDAMGQSVEKQMNSSRITPNPSYLISEKIANEVRDIPLRLNANESILNELLEYNPNLYSNK